MKHTLRVWLGLLAVSTVCALIASTTLAQRESNPYLVETRMVNGRAMDVIVVPGRPPAPELRPEAVQVPPPDSTSQSLSSVPAFTWCYGCSATSASMLAGWYDRNTYPNMYAGPANGGVCPLNNETTWTDPLGPSNGYCPLSATMDGLDGRSIPGHVDDYWVGYGQSGNDPCGDGWPGHTQGDCTGDYMGTNQDHWNNSDGSTIFVLYTDGTATYDNTYFEALPPDDRHRDGGHGLRLFVESRGYSLPLVQDPADPTPPYDMVPDVFNQYIYGYLDPPNDTNGFTFAQYKTEIDNWRPVLIHVQGHTMLGFGYDDPSTVYLCDTWDNDTHSMTWGSTYSGLQHYAVTCLNMDDPLPVVLVGLRAQRARGRIIVTWETATEAGAVGYVVLRSERPDRPFGRISDKVIVATGQPGEIARYEFVDEALQPGREYFYRIAEVSPTGAIEEIQDTTRATADGTMLYNLLPPQIRAFLPL